MAMAAQAVEDSIDARNSRSLQGPAGTWWPLASDLLDFVSRMRGFRRISYLANRVWRSSGRTLVPELVRAVSRLTGDVIRRERRT
jgi:hypothetical protein